MPNKHILLHASFVESLKFWQFVFPEVNFDKVDKIRGVDITIVIKSMDRNHSFELLKRLNFPFNEKKGN